MSSDGRPLTIFVDVDDTFVRSYGTRRVPIRGVIEHVQALYEDGAELYCWSSGGAAYARASAVEFEIEHCFVAFLPKPEVLIDDLRLADWRRILEVHPNECRERTVASYVELLRAPGRILS